MQTAQEAMAREEEAARNRMKKNELERKFRLVWYGNLALVDYFFVMALFCGAAVSRDPNVEGPYKFYLSMAWGGFEVLMAAVIGILSFLAAGKRRTPQMLLIGCFVAQVVLILSTPTYLVFGNLLGDGLGLVLNGFAWRLFPQWKALQELPGWPLFLGDRALPAQYEMPANLLVHPASKEMDGISVSDAPAPNNGTQMGTVCAPAAPPLRPSADCSLDAIAPTSAASISPKPVPMPTQSADLSMLQSGDAQRFLNTSAADLSARFGTKINDGTVPIASPQPQAQPEPQVSGSPSADALLAEMAASEHPTAQPSVSALPSPEEVMARLRAMKQQAESKSEPS